jgi:phospholipase C
MKNLLVLHRSALIAAVSVAAIALLLLSNVGGILSYSGNLLSGAQPNNSGNTSTPIKHIIIIMNENHAFDNFYGVFPGVPAQYALNLSTCMPETLPQGPTTPCVQPFNADNISSVQGTDQCHTEQCSIIDYNNAEMNGFIKGEDTNRTMAYYDSAAIPMLWDLASYYDLDYNFFSSAISYSEANHLFAVSANTPSDPFYNGNPESTSGTFLNFTYPEIGSELTRDGVSWGYFQYNWNDAKDCTGNYNSQAGLFTGGGGDGYWEGEAQFRQVQNTAIECSSLGNIKDFENALATNSLPAVSWVEPEPSESCHPGQGTLEACQLYTTSVIDDIEQSPVWNSSVTFLTYDEYGGYYDGLAPTQIDQWGDGFRVPLIAISPYTIPGLVGPCPSGQPSGATTVCTPSFSYYDNYTGNSGTTNREDFSALLSTIEYNWGVKNLTDTDGEEPNLFYMLNFNQTPLKPLFFSSNYSLAAYPLASCYSVGGCQVGTPLGANLASPLYVFATAGDNNVNGQATRTYAVYNASTPSWAEPNSESANYSGGNPDD